MWRATYAWNSDWCIAATILVLAITLAPMPFWLFAALAGAVMLSTLTAVFYRGWVVVVALLLCVGLSAVQVGLSGDERRRVMMLGECAIAGSALVFVAYGMVRGTTPVALHQLDETA